MKKPDSERILEISQAAYEAALGYESWDVAIHQMVDYFDAAGAVIFDLNRETFQFANWHSINLNHSGKYVDEMNSINPRMHYSLSQKDPHILTDFHCISPETLERHEFYRWLEKENSLKHFMGARSIDVGSTSTFLSVEFEATQNTPSKKKLDDFRALSIHFANVKRLENKNTQPGSSDSLDGFLGSLTSAGLFFLDAKGRFLFANDAGERMIVDGTYLHLANRHITMQNTEANRQLSRYYTDILASNFDNVHQIFSPLFVPIAKGAPPMLVRLMRLPHPLNGPGGKWTNWCLLVQMTPEQSTSIRIAVSTIFGLTDRETDLAMALFKHSTLAHATQAIGIAHNTGRVHLQKIFEKMKINSQTELVVILERLSAWKIES